MEQNFTDAYDRIRSGGLGFIRMPRGIVAVHGKEAVQFLNGLITNDVAKLNDGDQMLAAFPNAQGRLIAVVRVARIGDRFIFETEEATREKVYNNLFRFTFAGDFFVEDLHESYRFFSIAGEMTDGASLPEGSIVLDSRLGRDVLVPATEAENFVEDLRRIDAVEISPELYETLRIEAGIPLYGVDMDETTIVPELDLDGMISYNKGCYIGQEIIARIHFRGHVAKQLTGIVFASAPGQQAETRPVGSVSPEATELETADGKNAGRITSVTFSPKLGKTVALAYVRYDHLAEGTELYANDLPAIVKPLPFVS
ncbi:MAG: YgfZ/GcvT domain-containing protein [Pyrinomonadaceae bacterium]